MSFRRDGSKEALNNIIKIFSEPKTKQQAHKLSNMKLRKFRNYFECLKKKGMIHIQSWLIKKDKNNRTFYIPVFLSGNGVDAPKPKVKQCKPVHDSLIKKDKGERIADPMPIFAMDKNIHCFSKQLHSFWIQPRHA